MTAKTYFYDTYALLEILDGNPEYFKFIKDCRMITTRLQILEMHQSLLRIGGKRRADKHYDQFVPFCIDINDETFKEASLFRFNQRKKKLSYIDCIGYVIARNMQVPFLTGDKEFEEMEDVEFVK
ncbi:MAG: PIN domain-containing protein [archaeon]